MAKKEAKNSNKIVLRENEEFDREIESLLRSPGQNPLDNGPDENMPTFEHILTPYDYDMKKLDSTLGAKKILNSLLKFYLSQDFIDENDYIKEKAKLDELSLSGIIRQIDHNERLIEVMMRTIDTGVLEPKMFEVCGKLQQVYVDLIKMKATFLMNAEETFKKLRNDYDFYADTRKLPSKDTSTIQEAEVTSSYRGTRDLMKSIENPEDKDFKDPNEEPDTDFEEVEVEK